MRSQFNCVLTKEQAQKLRELLGSDSSFESCNREHTQYCYVKQKLSVAYYEKRSKLLIQGAGTDEFVEFTLEPKITGVPQLEAQPCVSDCSSELTPSENYSEEHFGIDESGKGDYFGPLVIAGVYTNHSLAWELKKLGCCDSKTIKNDAQIQKIAAAIRQLPGIAYDVVCIGRARYNEMYEEIGNLNRLLAWGQAGVIASLHEQVPDCPRALSDQFANEWVLKRALKQRAIPIQLEQRTKAESDIAVAAASILARARFTSWMREASVAADEKLPLGCASRGIKAGKKIVNRYGAEKLRDVAKLHFKTTGQICGLL